MAQADAEDGSTGTTDLADHVASDPDLSPAEQETSIGWTAEDDRATIYTEERGVMLSLLRSPVATIESLRVSDEERFGAVIRPDQYQSGAVTGVEATVPIGALKVKSEARTSNRRGLIVSDHDPGGSA